MRKRHPRARGSSRRRGRNLSPSLKLEPAWGGARALILTPVVRPTHTRAMVAAEPVAATDAALIAAWQNGDERAATELVHRHTRALARFLAGAGAPEADLDDLVQETFVRAFRAVDRFRGQCQFRTWLLTIGS